MCGAAAPVQGMHSNPKQWTGFFLPVHSIFAVVALHLLTIEVRHHVLFRMSSLSTAAPATFLVHEVVSSTLSQTGHEALLLAQCQ